ncbi:MAG: TetR/AcrR family transcriptional regulator [Lachnospiraceae bacterium]|nr:TetR/AcrR family transcriptional regulator [Lachnospiraceae bacterium]
MAGGFTDEERMAIREKLISAGYALIEDCGIKKMTIAMVAGSAGVAVGSFYNFFPSKEDFIVALISETEQRAMKKMMAGFSKDGTIALKKFLDVYSENFRPENNFYLRIRLEDWVWLKSHLKGSPYFNTEKDLEKFEFMRPRIKGIRKDIDPGVVTNFIKSIYAMYQNRDTLFEGSLQTNVDLIFDTLYRYMKA